MSPHIHAAGVYVWSRSLGLALVIDVAMVLSMVAAGVAGVLVPTVLSMLGQDPAQSSSIVLTTVTDIAGFASFLGIATMRQHALAADLRRQLLALAVAPHAAVHRIRDHRAGA